MQPRMAFCLTGISGPVYVIVVPPFAGVRNYNRVGVLIFVLNSFVSAARNAYFCSPKSPRLRGPVVQWIE